MRHKGPLGSRALSEAQDVGGYIQAVPIQGAAEEGRPSDRAGDGELAGRSRSEFKVKKPQACLRADTAERTRERRE